MDSSNLSPSYGSPSVLLHWGRLVSKNECMHKMLMVHVLCLEKLTSSREKVRRRFQCIFVHCVAIIMV